MDFLEDVLPSAPAPAQPSRTLQGSEWQTHFSETLRRGIDSSTGQPPDISLLGPPGSRGNRNYEKLVDSMGMMALHGFLCMAFAAASISLVASVGLMRPQASMCADVEGYSVCGMLEDIRRISSFAMGTLACLYVGRSIDGDRFDIEDELDSLRYLEVCFL